MSRFLQKKPPKRGKFGEARIILHWNLKPHKQRLFNATGNKAKALRKVIERNLKQCGRLQHRMTSLMGKCRIHRPKATTNGSKVD